jgi:predicted TPR repeat methyltransferase
VVTGEGDAVMVVIEKLREGVAALAADDAARALHCFEQALAASADDSPLRARLHSALAETHRTLGNASASDEHVGCALALEPDAPAARFQRGVSRLAAGQLEAAESDFRAALAADPRFVVAHYDLGVTLGRLGRLDEAVGCYAQVLKLEPGHAGALLNQANALHGLRRDAEARDAYRALLDSRPDHPTARHMLAALAAVADPGPAGESPASRRPTAEQPAPEYVAQLFDDCADRYDALMRDGLGYRMPEEMAALLAAEDADRRFAAAIDLGCGSGLMAQPLRPRVDQLWGVDLSPRMLELAAGRGYDRLEAGELIAFLETTTQRFELFVAADVLPYLGRPEPLLSAMVRCAAPHAWVLLSIERAARFELRRSGRYAHAEDDVLTAAESCGLRLRARRSLHARLDYGEPVATELLLFEAPPHGG